MTQPQPDSTETENWFVRRGVPHFIVDYSGAEDVLTRATPILILIFLFSAISAIDLEWPAWGIVAASLAGLALLLGAWALINRARGRRPLEPPDRIGNVEVAVFILVPSLLPLLFGGDLTGVLITAVTMIGLLLIQPDTIQLWTAEPPEVLARFKFWEVEMSITRELLQVAGFLAAFAGVYFSVYTTTDATLRADFFEDTVAEVRQNLAVRALYRESA